MSAPEVSAFVWPSDEEVAAVTPAMIDAALEVLRDAGLDLGATARVAEYVADGQTPAERAAGVEAMQRHDRELEDERRETVAAAIAAAIHEATP